MIIFSKIKIIFITIAILGIGFLAIKPVFAENISNLDVLFENNPLFKEASFLPGDEAARWIKVTNNSGVSKKIAIEAINKTNPDNLASKMNLVIKEGANIRYEKTLAEFFSGGEIYLSDLPNGNQTQYDLIVSFNSDAGNNMQGKSLGFDILIGFQGEEGISGGGGGGGGGGGNLPPGLTVSNESVKETDIEENSVTIAWTTSYASTSQVIYGKEGESHTLDLADNSGTPPKYGYANTTPEYDTSSKTTNHSVTVSGLTPGVVYYYRVVSHGSLAISYEYTLITNKEVINAPEKILFATGAGADARLQSSAVISTNQTISSYAPEEKPTEIAAATVIESGTGTETITETAAETPKTEGIETSKTDGGGLSQAGIFGGFINILSLGTGAEWLSVLMSVLLAAIVIYIIIYFVKKNRNKK